MKNTPSVVAIVGPTAVGKTAFSIDYALLHHGEVVSADSRQVYRGLNIGTGKVTTEEMRGIPHHLIDVADPMTRYTVTDFVRDARAAIDNIVARGKLPIIVGGTGMYIDVLVGRLGTNTALPDEHIRQELEALPLNALQEKLKSVDPRRFESIDIKNPRRLVRAIESALQHGSYKEPTLAYQVTWLGLTATREVLQERIVNRLYARLASGMIEEVEHLLQTGVTHERLEELGLEYRYISRYLRGEISKEKMVHLLEVEIYKYAKRQLTWFKKNPEIQWSDTSPRG